MARFQGLLAASVVGASLIGAAHAGPYTTVDFSAFYNFNPNQIYGFPSGAQTFAGVPFQMTVDGNGNDAYNSVFGGACDPCSITIPVSIPSASTVYTLINTWWGGAGANGGSVTMHGSLGDTFTYQLVAADNNFTYPFYTSQGIGNVRDYNPNGNTSDYLGDPSAQNVFTGDNGWRIDMQTIALPSVFLGETLDSITFTSLNEFGTWTGFIEGITVAAPEPGTLALFGVGLAALGWSRRRSASKSATA